jgi:tetratricopeptide (TPR) repeat protein
LHPFDQFALMGLGRLAAIENDDEKALAFFGQLLEIYPNSLIALASAANVHRKRRSYDKAVELYDKVLQIDPKNSRAWHGKADCLRGKQNYPSAIQAWNRALENGMDRRQALTRIGDSYIQLKDLSMAEKNFKKAMDIGFDKYAYLGISKVHERRRHLVKALEILTMLREREPEDTRISAEARRFMSKYPDLAKRASMFENAETQETPLN